MLSKAKIKLVQSLRDKKHRQEQNLFVAEGAKIVPEVLASKIGVKSLFATQEWIDTNHQLVNNLEEYIVAGNEQLKQMSSLQTPPEVIAVCEIPKFDLPEKFDSLTLVLDTIQDPGNLGTIIRIADWYGIKHIICSFGCADLFNPKVIQASMGSFTRVELIYIDELATFLNWHKSVPVFGALLNGQSIYEAQIPTPAFLLIGNEGSGISHSLIPLVTNPVTIPKRGNAESLNAAVATAIICDAWARSLSAGK